MRAELEAQIAARGLAGTVNLLGARPEHEVARMMAECDLFVLPSIVATGHKDGVQEGIPVALMEAMASARPAISTTTAGIPELIDDGISGLLVPPQDPRALAQAIRLLIDDPTRAASMGLNGRDKVQREFALSTCVAQLLARLDLESQGTHS
jgi:glycosyltransferase involved in cell wall biosynthesis